MLGKSERQARPAALVLALALASCGPAPELASAPPIESSRWQAAGAAAAEAEAEAEPAGADGWDAFGSPVLTRLVEAARGNNADVAVAMARVQQARGRLGVARSALLPTVDAGASVSGVVERRRAETVETGASAGVDLAYELDLFGRAAAGSRAARARLGAAGEDVSAARLVVESETAQAYVDYLALGARIALLDKALANARELERIIGVRVREGIATQVELGLQVIEARQIEAERARVIEARDTIRNALAVLTGAEAPRFRLSSEPIANLSAPRFSPLQPAELLTRRPDVRSAELQVAAAEGDVMAARKAFLPRLSVSASGIAYSGGVDPITLGASGLGSLVAAIFDGGRRRGQVVTAAGEQHEAVAQLRKSVLIALQETEDALSAIDQSERRLALLSTTRTAAARTAELARKQFVEGAADARTVLEAERGLLEIEQAHAGAQRDRLYAAIQLVRAMGGFPEAFPQSGRITAAAGPSR